MRDLELQTAVRKVKGRFVVEDRENRFKQFREVVEGGETQWAPAFVGHEGCQLWLAMWDDVQEDAYNVSRGPRASEPRTLTSAAGSAVAKTATSIVASASPWLSEPR